MSEIVRFSISLEGDLLDQFDRYCRQQQFATRSEAIRQLLRDTLTKQAWVGESEDAAGTLTLVFDHHRPQLRDQLLKLQHDHRELVVSTLHVHLTHNLCLEVIALRGPSAASAEDGLPTEGTERHSQGRVGDGQRRGSLRIGESIIVAFRSAKVAAFAERKATKSEVIVSPILSVAPEDPGVMPAPMALGRSPVLEAEPFPAARRASCLGRSFGL